MDTNLDFNGFCNLWGKKLVSSKDVTKHQKKVHGNARHMSDECEGQPRFKSKGEPGTHKDLRMELKNGRRGHRGSHITPIPLRADIAVEKENTDHCGRNGII